MGDLNTIIRAAVIVVVAVIGLVVISSVTADYISAPELSDTDFTTVPTDTGAATADALVAKNAFCNSEARAASNGSLFEGAAKDNSASWTTSDSPDDVCVVRQTFTGAVAIFTLLPLAIVGALIGLGYKLYMGRRNSMA